MVESNDFILDRINEVIDDYLIKKKLYESTNDIEALKQLNTEYKIAMAKLQGKY